MDQYDIQAWLDRVQTNLDIQVALQVPELQINFTRRELIELQLMLTDLKAVRDGNKNL